VDGPNKSGHDGGVFVRTYFFGITGICKEHSPWPVCTV
jgi:hypothetical protein